MTAAVSTQVVAVVRKISGELVAGGDARGERGVAEVEGSLPLVHCGKRMSAEI